jgi:transcriptional regulator with XRE-family HTH domain
MENESSWFGRRLKELRGQAKITQQQLANTTGLSVDALSRIERGNRFPTWDTVLKLSKALGVDCVAFQQKPRGK